MALEQAGMGLAVGDYMNNGLLDLYTGTFSDDYKPLFRNGGDAAFTEISPRIGLARRPIPFSPGRPNLSTTTMTAGRTSSWSTGTSIRRWTSTTGAHPTRSGRCSSTTWQGQKFEEIPPVIGTGLAEVIPGRGAAFGDLFNDGKIDVVINCMDHVPVADAQRQPGSSSLGGAEADWRTQESARCRGSRRIPDRRRHPPAHGRAERRKLRVLERPAAAFRIGDATSVDLVEIHWPSGFVESVTLPSVDRFFVIEEGKGVVPGTYDQPRRSASSTPKR
jgi:hypothetical protein